MPVDQADLHVNVPLSNLSIAYRNSGYVADRVFPVIPVVQDSDQFAVRDKRGFTRVRTRRAPKTEAPLVNWANAWDTYQCLEYALGDLIDDVERRNSRVPGNLDVEMVQGLTDDLLLDMEMRANELLTDTGTWTNSSPTAKWDVAGTGVIAQVRQAVSSVKLKRPNSMVISRAVVDALEGNTDILDRIKYTQKGILSDDLLPGLFGIPRVLIAEAAYNSTNPGQAESIDYIWGDDVWIGYVAGSPGLNTVSAGYIFRSQEMKVRKVREELKHSDHFEAGYCQDEKVVCDELGVLLTHVLT